MIIIYRQHFWNALVLVLLWVSIENDCLGSGLPTIVTAISWLRGDTDRPLGVTVTSGAVYRHPALLAVELTARPASQVLKVTRLTASSVTSSRWLTATLSLLYRLMTSSDWLTVTLNSLHSTCQWHHQTDWEWHLLCCTGRWHYQTDSQRHSLCCAGQWHHQTDSNTQLYRWQATVATEVLLSCDSLCAETAMKCYLSVCRHCSEMLPGCVQTL